MNLLGWITRLLPFTLPGWASAILGVLFTFVPIPVIAIIVAFGWWQLDKGSAVRAAVEDAITEFVTETERASLEAQLEGEREVSRFLRQSIQLAAQRAEKDREALDALLAEKRIQALTIQDQEDEIAEIMAARNAAVPSVADLHVFDRLRNR